MKEFKEYIESAPKDFLKKKSELLSTSISIIKKKKAKIKEHKDIYDSAIESIQSKIELYSA